MPRWLRDRSTLKALLNVWSLHVEYAYRGNEYGILFIFSLFCEYRHLEYVRIHAIYRVNQVQYVIHALVVAPQECVNTYSTRRVWSVSAQLSLSISKRKKGVNTGRGPNTGGAWAEERGQTGRGRLTIQWGGESRKRARIRGVGRVEG